MALATLGQICVRLGDLARAEDALHRALDVRSPIQFHETTGAVFDTLAQIHMIRGDVRNGRRVSGARRRCLRRVRTADQPVVRMVRPRPRRAAGDAARRARRRRGARPTKSCRRARRPFDALQATLIAAEALTTAGRLPEAEQRLAAAAEALDPKVAPAAWGEYLRLRGGLYAKGGSAADAYHNFAQSATLLDLLGERYQAALSHLALGRLVAQTGARSVAERHLNQARRRLRAARRRARLVRRRRTPAAC